MFDEYDLNSHTHDVDSCVCYACVLTRYWTATYDVLAPSAQERVERQLHGGRQPQRDAALLGVWGDVFDSIAESERIDRIVRYDQRS